MSETGDLSFHSHPKSIIDFINLYKQNLLNLEPGFQRQSVWPVRDRAKLIESVLRGWPVPAIFLYNRHDDGRIVYDVVDGKQRLESILMFAGAMRGRFSVKTQLPGRENLEQYDWARLGRTKMQHLVENYKLTVIEIDGALTEIINVFVLINSTGKPLTRQEKRKAKYYTSSFLREADRLARRLESHWRTWGVLSQSQVVRMRHTELAAELMLSIMRGEVLNKKAALDQAMKPGNELGARDLKRAFGRTFAAVSRVKRMFPKLYTTRFVKLSDYYSLVVLVSRYEAEGLILTDKRRNRLAEELLRAFSAEVDTLMSKSRKAETIRPGSEVYRQYLLTVREGTDRADQRRTREQVLDSLLRSLFAKKDAQRSFSSEQRRVMWNTAAQRKCGSCGRLLYWSDFTLDHIQPHSKGGKSRLENAALMCRSCNSSKGNRRSIR